MYMSITQNLEENPMYRKKTKEEKHVNQSHKETARLSSRITLQNLLKKLSTNRIQPQMTNENRFSPTVKQSHSQLPKDSQQERKPNLSPTPPSDWLFSDIRAKNLLHLFSIRLSLSQTKRPDTYIFYRSTKIKVSMRLSLSIFYSWNNTLLCDGIGRSDDSHMNIECTK